MLTGNSPFHSVEKNVIFYFLEEDHPVFLETFLKKFLWFKTVTISEPNFALKKFLGHAIIPPVYFTEIYALENYDEFARILLISILV